MAVTVGRSAEKAVKVAIFAALNVASMRTLGSASTPVYAVTVHGRVPQTLTYPHVRVDAAGELSNNTYGINGKDCRVYVQVFASSEEQALEIQSQVIALLNPVGNYHAIAVSGYTTIHVNYDGTQTREAGDDGNVVPVYQRTVMFTVTVEES